MNRMEIALCTDINESALKMMRLMGNTTPSSRATARKWRLCLITPGLGRVAILILAVIFMSMPSTEQAQQRAPIKRVVFVCEHGSVKSLIAATYFNQSAKARGLAFAAVARGTAPEPTVPRLVQDRLNADGASVSGFVPQLFRSADLDGTSLVVSFDQDIAPLVGDRVPLLHWDNLPGVLADYRRGRDAIVKKVDALLESLKKEAR